MPVQTEAMRRMPAALRAIQAETVRAAVPLRNPGPPGTMSVSIAGAFLSVAPGLKTMPDSATNGLPLKPMTRTS